MYVFYDSSRERKKALAGKVRRPEDRLPLAMIGGIMFPVTMFWFAWTAEYNSIHWIVPTIAGVFLSTSILLIFVAYLNYLTDSYLSYAASALAANTVCRSACGAAAPLFTNQMFTALGVGGGGSLIAGVACLLAPIPFIFFKYGEPIRKRSKFAPTDNADDKPQAKAEDEENKSHPSEGAERRRSDLSVSDEEERELDEQAGVPDEKDLDTEMEKQRSHETTGAQSTGDAFLDADGLERAERT